jgi:hypothetical protein
MAFTKLSNSKFKSKLINYANDYGNFSNTATGFFLDNGKNYKYIRFISGGTFTATKSGLFDILVVGAGGGGAGPTSSHRAGGGAGAVRFGTYYLTTGATTITVGSGGSGISQINASTGNVSSFGTLIISGGGTGASGFNNAIGDQGNSGTTNGGGSAGYHCSSSSGTRPGGGAGGLVNNYDGLTLNFTGTSVEYGKGGMTTADGSANTGGGGGYQGYNGGSGVVIVKVQI